MNAFSSSLFPRDPQPLFQLLAPPAADIELRSVLESQGIVAAGTVQQCVDAIEPDDRRAVNAKENRGVKMLLQRLHALANGVGLVGYVQLGVWTARGDVVDFRHGYNADLAARFHCDSFPILS